MVADPPPDRAGKSLLVLVTPGCGVIERGEVLTTSSACCVPNMDIAPIPAAAANKPLWKSKTRSTESVGMS